MVNHPSPRISHLFTTITNRPFQAPNLKADFEVKFLLKPDLVLSASDHTPIPSLFSSLSLTPTPIQMAVQFLDDNDKTLYTAGWSPRLRRIEGKPLELTYKKRYPIEGEDIDAALEDANRDGFDASEEKYEAQVEWGLRGMTLSVSREKKPDDDEGAGLELPDPETSRRVLIKEAPGKFDNFKGEDGWGVKTLQEARIYGPIIASRYVGVWEGVKVSLEIWPIMIKYEGRYEYVTEVSFKAKKKVEGGATRERLRALLEREGWLSQAGLLKTKLIMDNY